MMEMSFCSKFEILYIFSVEVKKKFKRKNTYFGLNKKSEKIDS